MFGPNLAALAEKRRVIAVELQGHGHTADIDRPMSFEAMADTSRRWSNNTCQISSDLYDGSAALG
jgi:pimeloyl-ACP methyl ester carboxylesterase